MPIYQYRCEDCRILYEELTLSASAPDPACPRCGQHNVTRLISPCLVKQGGTSPVQRIKAQRAAAKAGSYDSKGCGGGKIS